MLHKLGYVVGEEGKREWSQVLTVQDLTPLQISKEKMSSLRKIFYDKYSEDCLDIDQYLIGGVYFEFLQADKDKILIVKGNSGKSVENIVKGFNLPLFNEVNLSAQSDYIQSIKKKILPGQASPM
jgi:hypothetical protein